MKLQPYIRLMVEKGTQPGKYNFYILYKYDGQPSIGRFENISYEKILEFCELYAMLGKDADIYFMAEKRSLLNEFPDFGERIKKARLW